MVSFSCEVCNDTLTKKKLDQHRNQCRGATFTCIDCMTHFHGTDYRSHTSCISEDQKYQGSLYRDKKSKADKRKSINGTDAMVPRKAYVEDAPEGDESQTVAMIDVPPRAPTPPPAEPAVNALDFLVGNETPKLEQGAKTIERHTVHFANGDSQDSLRSYNPASAYSEQGFSYGKSPVPPSMGRFDSYANLPELLPSDSQMASAQYVTPAPKSKRSDKKEKHSTDKKRKRQMDDLDLSTSRQPSLRDEPMSDAAVIGSSGGRVLHSGLTGGLSRLVTDSEFYNDRIAAGPTPISPIKRSKRAPVSEDEDDYQPSRTDERRKSSHISHSTAPSSKDQHYYDRPPSSKAGHSLASHQHPHIQDRRSASYESEPRHHPRRHRSPMANGRSADYEIIERPASVQPGAHNQLVHQRPASMTLTASTSARADLFLSFIKGPDSQYGASINKVLKRYHRERDNVRTADREEDDKELWKALRLKRNDRGEIVLFVAE